ATLEKVSLLPLSSTAKLVRSFQTPASSCRGVPVKIHEYQGKELLKKFGVPVPRGIVAHTADEAFAAAKQLATEPVVVKAQIHAGGRGKGGGVKLAKSAEEARDIAQKM